MQNCNQRKATRKKIVLSTSQIHANYVIFCFNGQKLGLIVLKIKEMSVFNIFKDMLFMI